MSLEERIKNQTPFRDLPTWRKIVIVAAWGTCLVVGMMMADKALDIYGGDPDHAVPETGHIYPVHVNHGYLRYSTKEEHDGLVFWEGKMTWVGAPLLVSFFVWIMYRPKPAWPISRSEHFPK